MMRFIRKIIQWIIRTAKQLVLAPWHFLKTVGMTFVDLLMLVGVLVSIGIMAAAPYILELITMIGEMADDGLDNGSFSTTLTVDYIIKVGGIILLVSALYVIVRGFFMARKEHKIKKGFKDAKKARNSIRKTNKAIDKNAKQAPQNPYPPQHHAPYYPPKQPSYPPQYPQGHHPHPPYPPQYPPHYNGAPNNPYNK